MGNVVFLASPGLIQRVYKHRDAIRRHYLSGSKCVEVITLQRLVETGSIFKLTRGNEHHTFVIGPDLCCLMVHRRVLDEVPCRNDDETTYPSGQVIWKPGLKAEGSCAPNLVDGWT